MTVPWRLLSKNTLSSYIDKQKKTVKHTLAGPPQQQKWFVWSAHCLEPAVAGPHHPHPPTPPSAAPIPGGGGAVTEGEVQIGGE